MTHATRFVTAVVLTALALCAPVQAQTPEIDALRVRAEQGYASAQFNLGCTSKDGRGTPQYDVEAHMWLSLATAQSSGEDRNTCVHARNVVAERMTADQLLEAQRRAREWTPTPER